MHTYLNSLLCVAAPCDGEMQDAIAHAITSRKFQPTGDMLTDNETIGREGAQWLADYRSMVERNTTKLLASYEPLLAAALNRSAA
ncbi:MAG: hypothetical protein QOF48_3733 [Verrucomicrobiota bacterium]|jgi:hypothetical protein